MVARATRQAMTVPSTQGCCRFYDLEKTVITSPDFRIIGLFFSGRFIGPYPRLNNISMWIFQMFFSVSLKWGNLATWCTTGTTPHLHFTCSQLYNVVNPIINRPRWHARNGFCEHVCTVPKSEVVISGLRQNNLPRKLWLSRDRGPSLGRSMFSILWAKMGHGAPRASQLGTQKKSLLNGTNADLLNLLVPHF
jgi:hypothetical protein